MNNIPQEKINEFVRLQEQVNIATKELENLEKSNKGICEAYFSFISKDLFEANPRLISFSWDQYCPSWNDGDACYFSAHTSEASINGVSYYDEEDGIEETVEEGNTPLTTEERKTLRKAVSKFLNQFKGSQLEHWFGDGVEVVVTRTGVKTNSKDFD